MACIHAVKHRLGLHVSISLGRLPKSDPRICGDLMHIRQTPTRDQNSEEAFANNPPARAEPPLLPSPSLSVYALGGGGNSRPYFFPSSITRGISCCCCGLSAPISSKNPS